MKTNPTKEEILNELFSLKTIGLLTLFLTILFLFHIRLSTFVMMASSWGFFIVLAITKLISPIFKRT